MSLKNQIEEKLNQALKAKDKNTGAEQQITITGSSKLDDTEIDRMVKDAEQFAKTDKERRENVDAVNEAESTCYQASKQLESLDSSLADNDKTKVNTLITELKDLLAAGDNISYDGVKSKTNELRELMATLIQNIPDQDTTSAPSEPEDGTVETEIN